MKSALWMRVLASPPNWVGLLLASAVLLLKGLGYVGTLGLALAPLAYAAGFVIGGLWFGFPSRKPPPAWEALQFSDEGDAREAMERALHGVRRLTEHNPDNRIPASLQARVLDLCNALEGLLQQWERSRGKLSLEDSFHARHVAISYLPDALNSYLSIPTAYATTRLLANGKTAQQSFKDTLDALETKVSQLCDDLAAQDAQAFLVHSRVLNEIFAADVPASAASAVPAALRSAQKDAAAGRP